MIDHITSCLEKALLHNGPLAWALFEYDLEEEIQSYLDSKQEDGDDYLFAITQNANDVAMILIDQKNYVHVNENARAQLQNLWHANYHSNIEMLIPQMAHQLANGYLYYMGVQIAAD